MTSRQRGAAYILGLLVLGRVLDRFDLPFESRMETPRADSAQAGAAGTPGRAHAESTTAARRGMAPALESTAPPWSAAIPDSSELDQGPTAGGRAGAAKRGGDATAAAPPSAARAAAGDVGTRIPINTAGVAELQRLPGVGPVLAERIVEERRAHGALRSSADLQRVKGIGTHKAQRLAPLVRFD